MRGGHKGGRCACPHVIRKVLAKCGCCFARGGRGEFKEVATGPVLSWGGGRAEGSGLRIALTPRDLEAGDLYLCFPGK